MPTFTVRTTATLAAQVRDEARRRDINVVDLWREAMSEHLARLEGDRIGVLETRVDRIDAHIGFDSTAEV